MAFDETRRRISDFLSWDDRRDYRPHGAMVELQKSIIEFSPADRVVKFERLHNQAITYYEGFHKGRIPRDVAQDFKRLETRIEKLNRVDAAREYLAKHGGVLTREEIREAADNARMERLSREHEPVAAGSYQRTQERPKEQSQGREA